MKKLNSFTLKNRTIEKMKEMIKKLRRIKKKDSLISVIVLRIMSYFMLMNVLAMNAKWDPDKFVLKENL